MDAEVCSRPRHFLARNRFFPRFVLYLPAFLPLIRLFYAGCGVWMTRHVHRTSTRVLFHTTNLLFTWWTIGPRCRVHHLYTFLSSLTHWSFVLAAMVRTKPTTAATKLPSSVRPSFSLLPSPCLLFTSIFTWYSFATFLLLSWHIVTCILTLFSFFSFLPFPSGRKYRFKKH